MWHALTASVVSLDVAASAVLAGIAPAARASSGTAGRRAQQSFRVPRMARHETNRQTVDDAKRRLGCDFTQTLVLLPRVHDMFSLLISIHLAWHAFGSRAPVKMGVPSLGRHGIGATSENQRYDNHATSATYADYRPSPATRLLFPAPPTASPPP